jgi:hypothetical protein
MLTITALIQTLVRGSAKPSLGAIYIDVSFPRPSPRPCLGILVTWLPIDLVLLTKSITLTSFNRVYITDLILAVVELLGRDISRLIVEVREALELVELWDKG